jgi:TatD DNase family protein
LQNSARGIALFDAHAHLADAAFENDLDEVLARAAAAGVTGILAVCESLDDAARILTLADRHPIIHACAGLYPTILDRAAADAMEAFIREHRDRLAGVGEVGLDYWQVKEEADREIQRAILLRHIRLSLELDLPLNVHSRSAGRHAIEFLREHGATRVLMHAFDGKASSALAGIEAGYFFSIPPSIVRSEQKRRLVRQLPLDRMLPESDSPVLGPVPGERNEPANVRIACAEIAAIKGLSVQEVAETTTQNARRLFPRAFR